MLLSAHCIVKNEENFIWYAIKSVIDFVDQIIVFDTGSTDKTVIIINDLSREYPGKIIFEEKGECDKKRHLELRQEMLHRTIADWFMILDGDEIWTKRGMEEALAIIRANKFNCIIAPYFLCVGDVYHHSLRGKFAYGGNKMHASPRVFRRLNNLRWNIGLYGDGDYIIDDKGVVIRDGNYALLENKYWHTSALPRSSRDNEVILGRHKQVVTYSLKFIGTGFRIRENIPEVFLLRDEKVKKLPIWESWFNLLKLILFKLGFRKVRH